MAFSESARRSQIGQKYTKLPSTPSVVVIGQTSTRAFVTDSITRTSAPPILQIISSLTKSTTSKQFSTQISTSESRRVALSEQVTTTVFTRSSFLGFSEGKLQIHKMRRTRVVGRCFILRAEDVIERTRVFCVLTTFVALSCCIYCRKKIIHVRYRR